MKLTISGAILLLLGVLGIFFWHVDVLIALKGIFPVLFLLAGGLVLYLGLGELKEVMKQRSAPKKTLSSEDVEQYRQEIENLKKEVELLRIKETEKGIPPWMSGDLELEEKDPSPVKPVQKEMYDTPRDL